MDTLPQIFITSFLVGLSGALMPGPVLAVTISHATRRGFIVGPLIVLGTPSWNWPWSWGSSWDWGGI